ncbi:hypothetical protein GCM10010329_82620 [Streptomyces spiroverticillatus]|uniref:Uncharacterized protein n=1 Tax=Streptomyces finlayi TaxID=67296 RepID=A0A919CGI6_9ACTN|nr:hypothetical protein [Streptomyces finlayi]GHA47703.1 hypothetical protein GCM10010329_82620 [Streptomyces spiroverticillatus]GHD18670.1 hypothetical protein GCM10010334_81690 [Streptomyces finlayi]
MHQDTQTSTPQLDEITARGTAPTSARIRLADGTLLDIEMWPNAAVADMVYLFPGLTAPDSPGWQNQDPWEDYLTGDEHGGTHCLEVPVEAIRELIAAHGGEHQDQTDLEPTAEMRLHSLRGFFSTGPNDHDVHTAFARIHEAGGPYLVCVWEYADDHGFGGTRAFYAEAENGTFHEVRPHVLQWLNGQAAFPGPFANWTGAHVPVAFEVSDDTHNYARTER